MAVALPLTLGLITVGLCTLHLLAGFWLGWRVRGPEITDVSEINRHFRPQLSEVARLSEQLRSFAALCSSQFPALPSTITTAAEELAKAAALLNAHMQSAAERVAAASSVPAQQQLPTVSIVEISAKPDFGLASRELAAYTTTGRQCDDESEQTTSAARYRYETIQFAASSDAGLPQPAAFQQIRTLNVSSGGLSFFTEEQVAERSVVVTLGTVPDLRFFMARIEHTRLAYRYGVHGFVVGCRFLTRIEDVFVWSESAGEIALKLDDGQLQEAGLEQTCARR